MYNTRDLFDENLPEELKPVLVATLRLVKDVPFDVEDLNEDSL